MEGARDKADSDRDFRATGRGAPEDRSARTLLAHRPPAGWISGIGPARGACYSRVRAGRAAADSDRVVLRPPSRPSRRARARRRPTRGMCADFKLRPAADGLHPDSEGPERDPGTARGCS